MYLVITIDTEEDNWGSARSDNYGCRNIERIPLLQGIFDKYGIKATYLVTYPVANDDRAIKILGEIEKDRRCEIGTHPHPWNTPPLLEEKNEKNSFINNLTSDLQFRKIQSLDSSIRKNLNVNPISYRSGRWGFDEGVARNLLTLGYKIDTSISPFTDWTSSQGPDFRFERHFPRKLTVKTRNEKGETADIIEIPATIGYLQNNQNASNFVYYRISRSFLRKFHIMGLLSKMKCVNRIWLSPETSRLEEMIGISEAVIRQRCKVLNVFFHSSSLLEGHTPFVTTSFDRSEFLIRIEKYLMFAKSRGFRSLTLSETLNHLPDILGEEGE